MADVKRGETRRNFKSSYIASFVIFFYLREQMVRRIFCVTSVKIRVISDPERCRRYAFICSSCANILFGYSVPSLYTKHCIAFNPLDHERYR
jgi:hypothetical protein